MMSARSVIVAYYSGEAPDIRGRMIDDVWGWDDERLESVHDYIQWLFPLAQPSQANPYAPLLSREDAMAFAANEHLRNRLLESFRLMLRFYGLGMRPATADGTIVTKNPSFDIRGRTWLRPGNHNYLRLTRILISSHTLGLVEEARALQRFLVTLAGEHADEISRGTLSYWIAAVPH